MAIQLDKFNISTPECSNGVAKTYWWPNFPNNTYFNFTRDSAGNIDAANFWAPRDGCATPSVSRTRTELREAIVGEQDEYNWTPGDGTDLLRAALTLQQVVTGGKVMIGQIHLVDRSTPAMKILWDNGNIRMLYRPSVGGTESSVTVAAIPLNQRFTYSVNVNSSLVCSLWIGLGTQKWNKTFQMSSGYRSELAYFKAGVYNQIDRLDTTPGSDGSRATFWKVEVEH